MLQLLTDWLYGIYSTAPPLYQGANTREILVHTFSIPRVEFVGWPAFATSRVWVNISELQRSCCGFCNVPIGDLTSVLPFVQSNARVAVCVI